MPTRSVIALVLFVTLAMFAQSHSGQPTASASRSSRQIDAYTAPDSTNSEVPSLINFCKNCN
jgi:hypothetical protein